MARDLNKVQLIGNLGSEPETRVTRETGKKMVTFTMATSERWRDKNDAVQERTEWHTIAIMGDNLVDLAKRYLKKGGKVYIEGTLRTRSWTTASGEKRTTSEIFVQQPTGTILPLDPRGADGDSDVV
jgi:single-strand DNA-binding protein